MSELLGRNAIAAAQDRVDKITSVPEWGGDVRVMTVVGTDRVEWEKISRKLSTGEITMTEASVFAASKAIVDQDGKKIFDDDEGRKILATKNMKGLMRIFSVIMEVNSVDDEAVEAKLGES